MELERCQEGSGPGGSGNGAEKAHEGAPSGEPSLGVFRDEGWRGARRPASLGDPGKLKRAPQAPFPALGLEVLAGPKTAVFWTVVIVRSLLAILSDYWTEVSIWATGTAGLDPEGNRHNE